MYYVRKSFEDVDSQVAECKTLTTALKKASSNDGYYVFDDEGAMYPVAETANMADSLVDENNEPITTVVASTDSDEHVEVESMKSEESTSGYAEVIDVNKKSVVNEFIRRKSLLY